MVRQSERSAPLAGIMFVLLLVVGTSFVADVPDPDAPAQEIVDGDQYIVTALLPKAVFSPVSTSRPAAARTPEQLVGRRAG